MPPAGEAAGAPPGHSDEYRRDDFLLFPAQREVLGDEATPGAMGPQTRTSSRPSPVAPRAPGPALRPPGPRGDHEPENETERPQDEAMGTPGARDVRAPVGPDPMEMADDEDFMDEDAAADPDMSVGFIGSLSPNIDDEISEILLQQLGGTKRFIREKRQGYKKMVSETYSPPRVTKELKRSRNKYLVPGFALDLTVTDDDDGEPWDFSRPEKREKARRRLRSERPYLLIGSPMCRAFSTWQAFNEAKCENPEAMERAKVAAQVHVDFVVSLYVEQLQGHRYFLHEHPRWASSWNSPFMEELMKVEGVHLVHGDQCQYGAEVQSGLSQGSPVMKPTGFLSNARSSWRPCRGDVPAEEELVPGLRAVDTHCAPDTLRAERLSTLEACAAPSSRG